MNKKLAENTWLIEKEGEMKVPGIIFASDKLFEKIKSDKTLEQVKNVAKLPGIIQRSIAMPDAHQGYGFSIGGVAAFDLEKGIISPGGIGYDINCGVRLLITDIKKEDFLKKRSEILKEINKRVPSGVGETSDFKLNDKELNEVLDHGLDWAIERGYATKEDKECIEDNGALKGDSSKITPRAKARGRAQLGTLGAGNHFLEIQEVETIYDKKTSKEFGIKNNQIVIMIHTGSRGLGHQTASDYLKLMEKEYGFASLPDRELACSPINSKLGKDYFLAMSSAANYAFVNRQLITHQIRKSFEKFFPQSKISLLYDVAHNIAKIEKHKIDGKIMEVCVHRKGATRSFGPGRKELPKIYQKTGQPVILPGSMGTFSYLLVGTKKAEELSFASTAHGAGRIMSRSSAKSSLTSKEILANLKSNNIEIIAGSQKGIVEEAPQAYKDINEVAKVSNDLGIGNLVARLKPLAVIKG
jgi:tRNA-splicing ligase RtcB